MRSVVYLKAVVIVHGKSEKQMCDFIKQQLRLKMHIESDKKGEKSIQITGLNRVLNNDKFKSKTSFLNFFEDIKVEGRKKEISKDFKIFIIMDTDDCSQKQKENYINKEMFKEHWAYDYIVPIYNSPELETVLTRANIKFTKEGNKRKKEYIKIFPTDEKYIKSDVIQISKFSQDLKKVNSTNMECFVDFCLAKSS